MNEVTDFQKARLEKAKAKKEPKSKFKKKETAPEQTPAVTLAQASGDQKATPSGDQKPARAKKESSGKKPSRTFVEYKKTKAFPLDHIIKSVMRPNPKGKGSAKRYDLYEDGMTVGAYIEKAKKHDISGALAANDVRWDYVKGFIEIVAPGTK